MSTFLELRLSLPLYMNPSIKLFNVIGSVVIAVCLIPAPLQAQSSQIAQDIDLTFTYTHGFAYESWSEGSEAKEILNRMRSTPEAYVAELDSRFVFPDNANLISYPTLMHENSWLGNLDLLDLFGRMNVGVRSDVVAILVRINAEVTEDIDLIEDEIVNNPPADPYNLKEALEASSSLYRKTLRTAQNMNEPALLRDALERYDSQGFSNNRFIEAYSITVTGSFPPPDTFEVKGGEKQE